MKKTIFITIITFILALSLAAAYSQSCGDYIFWDNGDQFCFDGTENYPANNSLLSVNGYFKDEGNFMNYTYFSESYGNLSISTIGTESGVGIKHQGFFDLNNPYSNITIQYSFFDNQADNSSALSLFQITNGASEGLMGVRTSTQGKNYSYFNGTHYDSGIDRVDEWINFTYYIDENNKIHQYINGTLVTAYSGNAIDTIKLVEDDTDSILTYYDNIMIWNGSPSDRPLEKDTTQPTINSQSINETNPLLNDYILFSADSSDDEELSQAYLATNLTGSYVNESAAALAGVTDNATKTIQGDTLGTFGYLWTIVDASGNSIQSAIADFNVRDGTAPSLGGASISDATPDYGDTISIRQEAEDDIALNEAYLATNATGSYANESAAALTGTADNATKSITADTPGTIGYFWTITDEAGNSIQSSIQTFLTGAAPTAEEQAVIDEGGFAFADIAPVFLSIFIVVIVVIGVITEIKYGIFGIRKVKGGKK